MVLVPSSLFLPVPLLGEMSDATWQSLIAATLVISQAIISAVVTIYLGKKQDKTDATVRVVGSKAVAAASAAVEAVEANAVRVNEVGKAVAVSHADVGDKLTGLLETTGAIHKLANGGTSAQLRLIAYYARRLAEKTDATHKDREAADRAERMAAEHDVRWRAAETEEKA